MCPFATLLKSYHWVIYDAVRNSYGRGWDSLLWDLEPWKYSDQQGGKHGYFSQLILDKERRETEIDRGRERNNV